MEILFKEIPHKQSQTDPYSPTDLLDCFGIDQCFLREMSYEKDRFQITRKRHYHTGFEIHIIESGSQLYEVESETLCLESGQFLLIPPQISHAAVREAPSTTKYVITFVIREDSRLIGMLPHASEIRTGFTPTAVRESLQRILTEQEERKAYSSSVIGMRVWECILHFLRLLGLRDCEELAPPSHERDERVLLAKQYIQDNIMQSVTVSELAYCCCISVKQLSRIFRREVGLTVSEYIRKQRCKYIQELLADPTLSLRTISEMMQFNNEYYFNAFFKKYAGMTPGAFRKSVLK